MSSDSGGQTRVLLPALGSPEWSSAIDNAAAFAAAELNKDPMRSVVVMAYSGEGGSNAAAALELSQKACTALAARGVAKNRLEPATAAGAGDGGEAGYVEVAASASTALARVGGSPVQLVWPEDRDRALAKNLTQLTMVLVGGFALVIVVFLLWLFL